MGSMVLIGRLGWVDVLLIMHSTEVVPIEALSLSFLDPGLESTGDFLGGHLHRHIVILIMVNAFGPSFLSCLSQSFIQPCTGTGTGIRSICPSGST